LTRNQLIDYVYRFFSNQHSNKFNSTLFVDELVKQVGIIDEVDMSVRNLFLGWLCKNELGNRELIAWIKSKTFEHEKDFKALSKKKLSEDFIREFEDKVNWYRISKYQVLSESFIREFEDRVNWKEISEYQVLSESFIREFEDRVNWERISKYQKLSENFIRELVIKELRRF